MDVLLEPFHRRPLLGAMVLFTTGLVLGDRQKSPWILVITAIVLGGVLLVRVMHKKAHVAYMALLIFLILGYVAMFEATKLSPLTSLLYEKNINISCRASGTVRAVKETDSGLRYELSQVTIRYHNYDVLCEEKEKYVNLTSTDGSSPVYEVGDVLEITGTIGVYPQATNPGEFDLRQYYATRQIYLRLSETSMTCVAHSMSPLQKICNRVRSALTRSYMSISDSKSASVFGAMLLGNRDDLDEELSELFSICGIGHILAISGLHISLLGMGIYRGLRRSGLKIWTCIVAGILFMLFYGALTGNGVSTVRASIMFAFCVMADALKRSYDILSAASVAAILMLFASPQLLYSCGFLLSYGAILGIVLVNDAFHRILPTRNSILRAFLGSLSIQLTTAPITLWFYYKLPTWSVFLNLLVIPLMTVLMMSALVGGVCGIVFPHLGKFAIGPAVWIVRFYELLCQLNLKFPKAILTLGRPAVWQIILYYALLLAFVYCSQLWNRKRILALVLSAALVLGVSKSHGLQVTFLDVGQGDGIFLRTPNDMTMLIDGGSTSNRQVCDYVLVPFLEAQGITRLDYCLVTHADEDHINGLRELMLSDSITITHLLLPNLYGIDANVSDICLTDSAYGELILLARQKEIAVDYIQAGMSIRAGEVSIDCIHPSDGNSYAERNCSSTSLVISFGDFNLLTCGDLCEDEERQLSEQIAAYAPIEVVKANHHGSRHSNTVEFFEGAQAQNVIISCGRKNSYSHPHVEALQRMEQSNVTIWRTDKMGAITVQAGHGRYRLIPYLQE